MEFKHLVCVTSVNNNKFYDMKEQGDGTFIASYGRVGYSAATKVYPMSKWNSIHNQKIGKGYEDVTSMVAVPMPVQTQEDYKPIEDTGIRALIQYLREQAKETVKQHYTVASEQVTPKMVVAAQEILNDLSTMHDTVKTFNDKLLQLFTTIPRRMGQVSVHLAKSSDDFEQILHREQQLLDVMSGQVSTVQPAPVSHEGDASQTILEANGLTFAPATDKDVEIIKKQLGAECADLFYKAWRVENLETRKKFKAFTKGKGRITKKLFWHGSRTENWWSILRSGLVLRPTNAVINGKMFGYGLYFAPRARKSVGYTSLRGSYWAGGHSQYSFMALYEVVYGTPYNVNTNAGCGDMTYEKLQRVAPGCSSLHAHAGSVLKNDEIIVYKEEQTTIKYLVELKR